MSGSIYDEERGPVWGWSTGPDSERWYGSLSRDHAEQEASEEEDGGYIVEGRYPDAGLCAAAEADRMAEDLLEWMNDRDDVGGGDEPVFEQRAGAVDALALLLQCWAKTYITVNRWAMTGTPIRVEPEPED